MTYICLFFHAKMKPAIPVSLNSKLLDFFTDKHIMKA